MIFFSFERTNFGIIHTRTDGERVLAVHPQRQEGPERGVSIHSRFTPQDQVCEEGHNSHLRQDNAGATARRVHLSYAQVDPGRSFGSYF